jgi:hypothetical protein
MLISILLALALSTAALAQSQGQSPNQGNQGSQAQNANGKNISGTVSHDRKTFKNDANNKNYKVDNPDALKGEEDQHVAVIVAVDPDTNTSHIIQGATAVDVDGRSKAGGS